MQSGQALDGLRGLWPLAFCVIYFLNPWRSHELAYAVFFGTLALLSLWKNPFRGQSRSALLLSVAYAVATIVMFAKFIYGHHWIDALWAGVFSVMEVGWWCWYRHDIELGKHSSSARDTSLETNHG